LPPTAVTPDEPDYADFASLPSLGSTLDRLQSIYGSSTRLPIYSTEFGYQTNPPEKLARTTAPAVAATYLNWAEYLSWRDPRIRSYDQYLLIDPPGGNFATGLEFANGTPKPTYDAYRLPIYLPVTSGPSSQPLEVWGCARPARYANPYTRSAQLVRVQFRPAVSTAFETVRSVQLSGGCYFDVRQQFKQSGSVRLSYTDADGRAIFSRSVAITVH
jgi:hypothetical protein